MFADVFLLGGLFWFHRKKKVEMSKYQLAENRGIPQSYKLIPQADLYLQVVVFFL